MVNGCASEELLAGQQIIFINSTEKSLQIIPLSNRPLFWRITGCFIFMVLMFGGYFRNRINQDDIAEKMIFVISRRCIEKSLQAEGKDDESKYAIDSSMHAIWLHRVS